MPARFSETVVLVAGGTGALGRAVSLAFLSEGASVVATSRRSAELDALRSDAGAAGNRLSGEAVDVTDEAAVAKLLAAIRARARGASTSSSTASAAMRAGRSCGKRTRRPSTTCWR